MHYNYCPSRYMDDEMAKDIENSVLERCSPHGDVVHVYVDRRSPFVSLNLRVHPPKWFCLLHWYIIGVPDYTGGKHHEVRWFCTVD